jgi:transcriptional regulator with XRE-family HTH domain
MGFHREFGTKLRRTRQEKRMSQDDLADLSGLHRTVISKHELGKTDVMLSSIYKLAGALGVSVSELCSEIRAPQRVERE